MNQPSQIPTAADFFAQAEEDDTDESYDAQHHRVVEVPAVADTPAPEFAALMEEWKYNPSALHILPPDPMERIATALEAMAGQNDRAPRDMGAAVKEGIAGVSMVPVTAHDALRDEMHERVQGYVEALHDETSKLQTVTEVISGVEAALGKSTAKPVLAAKAVIEAWKNPQVPGTADVETSAAEVLPGIDQAMLPGHTRAETGEDTPDICQECSYSAQDYVVWPCTEIRQAFDPIGTEAGLVDTGLDHALETYPAGGPLTPVQAVEAPAHDAPVEAWRDYARSKGMAGPQIDKANRSQIRTALGIAQPGTA